MEELELNQLDFQFNAQAHILNLPVGHEISTKAKDSVKLDGVKVKLADKKTRWKSVVGVCIIIVYKISSEVIFSDGKCGTSWASGSPRPRFPCGISCNQHNPCRLEETIMV